MSRDPQSSFLIARFPFLPIQETNRDDITDQTSGSIVGRYPLSGYERKD